MNYKEMD